jgi:plasmid stabilization system protein ParE
MGALPIVRTWNADQDLHAIWSLIAKDSRSAADGLIRRLDRKFEQLARMPTLGERQPQLGDLMRREIVGKYLIFYEAHDDSVIISRVLHSARRWEDLVRD